VQRATALLAALPAAVRARVSVSPMPSTVGGGSLPGETLESAGLSIAGRGPDALAHRLRTADPAVIGRVQDGSLLLDLRTIDPTDDEALGHALGRALAGAPGRV